jgi:hypothetical protein
MKQMCLLGYCFGCPIVVALRDSHSTRELMCLFLWCRYQAHAAAAADDDDDEGEVDESGVEPNDIELVMTQVQPAALSSYMHACKGFKSVPCWWDIARGNHRVLEVLLTCVIASHRLMCRARRR